jgi:P4 family phage/plasmid primase-like protien
VSAGSMRAGEGVTLRQEHADHLARFRIPSELLAGAGVRSVSDSEARTELGLNGLEKGHNCSGILFPYFAPGGERAGGRVRLDLPLTSGGKYVSEPQCKHLYFPPGCAAFLGETSVPVILVEAEKSALALCAYAARLGARLLPIALGGCWGWKRKNGKHLLPDGGSEWVTEASPDLDLLTWRGREVVVALDSNARSNEAVRSARRALVKELKERGAKVRIAELPEGVNGPDDLIAERGDEAMKAVLRAGTYVGEPLRTDGGNSDRFVREHGDSVRWCAEQGAWYAWEGRRWQRNAIGEVNRRARQTAKQMWDEVAAETDEKEKKNLNKWALHGDSHNGLGAMVSLARYAADVEVVKFADAFDRDPLLLNCTNGILDLRTGTLRPHCRTAMLTKLAGVAYEPKARHPQFTQFLMSTFPDGNLLFYVQRVVGYCLTGLTSEQALFILYGDTKTGKSTFVKIVRGLLGEYATSLPDGALLARKFQEEDAHAAADLPGVRLATAVETAKGRRLNEAKVKQLTGEDFIRARHLYENSAEFRSQAKLFLATNHLPVIRETDDAIWGRIKPMPFKSFVPPEKRVADLEKKLIETEGSGILNWALEGCREWQARGLQEPACVTLAAKTYRSQQDEVGDWLEENCTRCTKAHEHTSKLAKAGECFSASAAELYRNYEAWARESGIKRVATKTGFGIELGRLGLRSEHIDGARGWLGVRLGTLGK